MPHQKIKIWDLWVRLFHWSLACSVIFMLISGETGFQFYEWHKPVGEGILALLVFRILWGFWGSSNARFVTMIQSPLQGVKHLVAVAKRAVHPERGHNAAGGWAALFMLLSVLVQVTTGLFIADEDEFIEGAFYGSVSEDMMLIMLQVHYLNAELLMAFVFIHVGMILVYWIYTRTNLITPMVSGFMQWDADYSPPNVSFQKSWLGFVLAVCAAGCVYFLINTVV